MDLEGLYDFARSFWVVWLMLLFGGIIWWAYRPKNRQRFEDAARIPFEEEDQTEGTDGWQGNRSPDGNRNNRS